MLKKIFWIVLGVCLVQTVSAHAEWAKLGYGGAGYYQDVMGISQAADGDFLSSGHGNITKFEGDGTITWSKEFPDSPFWTFAEPTLDGGYIVAGYTGNKLTKLSSDGSVEWQKSYKYIGSASYSNLFIIKFLGIRQAADGGYLVYGSAANIGHSEPMVCKMDSEGNLLWQKVYDYGVGFKYSRAIAIDLKLAADGGYVTYAFVINRGSSAGSEVWILKSDVNGSVEWHKSFELGPAAGLQKGDVIQPTRDGGYIFCALNNNPNYGLKRMFAVKLQPDGTVAWQKELQLDFTLNGLNTPNVIEVGGGYVLGVINNYSPVLIKLDEAGSLVWKRLYSYKEGLRMDFMFSLLRATDGRILFGGRLPKSLGGSYGEIFKVSPEGNILGCSGVQDTNVTVQDVALPELVPNSIFGNIEIVADDDSARVVDAYPVTTTYCEASENLAPVLDPIGDREIREGQTLAFTVAATDADINDTLFYSVYGLPEGAEFESETGVFSWRPDYHQAGEYEVDIYVMDDGTPMREDSETITITVFDVLPAEVAGVIIDEVFNLELTHETENSYSANLTNAQQFIDDDRGGPANNQLEAFIHKVEQDIDHGDLSVVDGAYLIGLANELIDLLNQ